MIDTRLTIQKLGVALNGMLPPDLPWKEEGSGTLTITVHKSVLREARDAMKIYKNYMETIKHHD